VVIFHHVNLGVPVGGGEDEAAFLVDVIGYARVQLPPGTPSMAMWFESADGKQVHLSEDPDHRPAARAHVAVELGAELTAVKTRLTEQGYSYDSFDGEDFHLAFCQDPAGNRWELRGTP
jgi:hypothetical protein